LDPSRRSYWSAHRDRTTLLLIGGLVLLLLGFIALMVMFFVAVNILALSRMPVTERAPAMTTARLVPALLLFAGSGTVFSILGLGALLRRRWFEPLLAVFAWGWLFLGILNALMTSRILPLVGAYGPERVPGTELASFKTIGGVLLLVDFVVPGLLLLLFTGHHVRATLAAHDPETRWTDRVPTAVLGLSCFVGAWALVMLIGSLQAVIPLGGSILTGERAVFVCVASAFVLGATAVGLFQRRPGAWWGGVAILIAWGVWSVTTLPRIDFQRLLRAADLPPGAEIQQLTTIYQGPWFQSLVAAFLMAALLYFFRVRRYFE